MREEPTQASRSDAAPFSPWRGPELRKMAALVASIVLLLLSGYLSWRQPSPGQLDLPAVFPHLKWFRYPIEVNPENRPPTYPSNWFWYPLAVNPQNRPPTDHIFLDSIAVIPGSSGKSLAVVGTYGTILHTTDGGASWNLQNSVTRDLWSVTFPNSQLGWAVGMNGIILHTADGGSSWLPQRIEPGEDLSGVAFSNAQLGWAVGRNGTILHTTDGGFSWLAQRTRTRDLLFDVKFANPQTGWAVGENGTILHTTDGGASWNPQSSGVGVTLDSVTFTDFRQGWVVGEKGTILHTTDGGASWNPQSSGIAVTLASVTFTDSSTGWAVGMNGTILHTTDGGASWSPQEGFTYRRYPAPWFYLTIASLFPLFIWALIPIPTPSTTVQDSVIADSPVESLEDDRLGQRPLVERLAGFLQNRNTLPPLVISLQAPWGMGKSTVMRMLQTSLERNRAAVTVWFNAWHHQKEDQLLAYLLETVQKEAVPQWLSRNGLSFRVNLIRERLFSWNQIDRLVLVLAGIALVVVQHLRPGWLSAIPGQQLWLPYAAPFVAALPILDALVAFKSNPDKLIDKSGGVLVDTFKELIRLPSLVGKSDVRQEFANNFRDVVAALGPQRLVIFLDDLDRCKPEQVVQILESINFLSSIAQCFLIVGADYEKVEALVANQFETIALREAENKANSTTGLDTIKLRVKYARNYLKKIVNLRLNLHPPTGYVGLLTKKPGSTRKVSKLLPLAGTFATVAVLVLLIWSITLGQQSPRIAATNPVTAVVTPTSVPTQARPAQNVVPARGPTPLQNKATGSNAAPAPVQQDGYTERNLLSVGIPLLLAIGALLYWFNQPRKTEEAQDADTFTEALETYSDQIFKKYESPREARRFLNYLRLVATTSGQKEKDALKTLRNKYPSQFDRDLVSLAVLGDWDHLGDDSEVKQYYKQQCDLFGLDEKTFQPKENGAGPL